MVALLTPCRASAVLLEKVRRREEPPRSQRYMTINLPGSGPQVQGGRIRVSPLLQALEGHPAVCGTGRCVGQAGS